MPATIGLELAFVAQGFQFQPDLQLPLALRGMSLS
jgi:hypothetical protein